MARMTDVVFSFTRASYALRDAASTEHIASRGRLHVVSYIGLNPAQLGVLIPQDPLTGALRLDQAIIFDLLTQVSYQSQGAVARHPVQSGREGPSDSILEEPERCTISAVFSDKTFTVGLAQIPVPFSEPDRCLAKAQQLANMKSKRQLVTAVLPGRVLADRAISMLETTPSADGAQVDVTLTLEHVRVVSLTLIAAVADSDTIALGLQTTETGM